MQKYAFAPDDYDRRNNLDILTFVPYDAATWSLDQAGAGQLSVNRDTGDIKPYGATKELPVFNAQDLVSIADVQEDCIALFEGIDVP